MGYTRNENKKREMIEALNNAQRLAFSPLSFQAIGAAIDFNILKELDKEPLSFDELLDRVQKPEYIVKTLVEVLETIDIVKFENDKYSITKLGQLFLYDEMTRVNFNFVKDVCYKGAAALTDSFKKAKPLGLKEILEVESDTIYPYLSILPEQVKKSWYEFDHYYSDNCFDLIYKIVFKGSNCPIFDIGGNMGAFEKVCLKNDPTIDITMIDLEKNIEYIKDDPELKGCKFFVNDVLSDNPLPKIKGKVLMSQFLDCFSKEKIIHILNKINKYSSIDTKIYILEPFIDEQKFDIAKLSLAHTSLYFTSIANGYSKMYTKKDMESYIKSANWRVIESYSSIGAHDYTLLECEKDV